MLSPVQFVNCSVKNSFLWIYFSFCIFNSSGGSSRRTLKTFMNSSTDSSKEVIFQVTTHSESDMVDITIRSCDAEASMKQVKKLSTDHVFIVRVGDSQHCLCLNAQYRDKSTGMDVYFTPRIWFYDGLEERSTRTIMSGGIHLKSSSSNSQWRQSNVHIHTFWIVPYHISFCYQTKDVEGTLEPKASWNADVCFW